VAAFGVKTDAVPGRPQRRLVPLVDEAGRLLRGSVRNFAVLIKLHPIEVRWSRCHRNPSFDALGQLMLAGDMTPPPRPYGPNWPPFEPSTPARR